MLSVEEFNDFCAFRSSCLSNTYIVCTYQLCNLLFFSQFDQRGHVWSFPDQTVLPIGEIESKFHPQCLNHLTWFHLTICLRFSCWWAKWWTYVFFNRQDVFVVPSHQTVISQFDLSGVDQLTDMFFIMVNKLHKESLICKQVSTIIISGCLHVTDRGICWMVDTFPRLEQVHYDDVLITTAH